LSYSASSQKVSIAWEGSNNATAVYVNGDDFGMDFYKSTEEIYAAGAESELYLTGPTHTGYKCFTAHEDCES
jgi:hypothetical protein